MAQKLVLPSPLSFPNWYESCNINPVDTLDHWSSHDLREICEEIVLQHAIILRTLTPSATSIMTIVQMYRARLTEQD